MAIDLLNFFVSKATILENEIIHQKNHLEICRCTPIPLFIEKIKMQQNCSQY